MHIKVKHKTRMKMHSGNLRRMERFRIKWMLPISTLSSKSNLQQEGHLELGIGGGWGSVSKELGRNSWGRGL